ncbi:hypothetical protein CCACVL1_29599 [Corchorus capsularis]|uniref:Uncharacterized protein n=1 Tax=Corchorus capsularis TaxID=210143 RepID=A0A1R3G150_COCAP|nr:hypothetical protein CCACVL1_29599 [Corchorus capsularis]
MTINGNVGKQAIDIRLDNVTNFSF